MTKYFITISLAVFSALFAWSGTALGAATGVNAQLIEKNGNLCAAQTRRQERLARIPRHLLTAISVVESGFWDSERKENVAWPWAVTSGSKNWYFATKEDAITQVLELWADGVKNIDVGCMQINLHYHGDAFKGLEQAFDPSKNVAYAVKYLKNMYSDAKSWTKAAGNYHSKTPDKHRRYKLKVIKAWNEARRTDGYSVEPKKHKLVRIDRDRTKELNSRLRKARAANLGENPEAVRQGQFADWRGGASGRAKDFALAATKRRAQLESARRRDYRGLDNAGDRVAFAAKRKDQLKYWRLNVANDSGHL